MQSVTSHRSDKSWEKSVSDKFKNYSNVSLGIVVLSGKLFKLFLFCTSFVKPTDVKVLQLFAALFHCAHFGTGQLGEYFSQSTFGRTCWWSKSRVI